MSSDHDSFHHKVETDGDLPIIHILDSEGKDLAKWFQEYTAEDGNDLSKYSEVIQVLDSDELDADFVEQQIRESTPKSPVKNGFCAKCQDLFNNWPTLGGSSTREHDSMPDPDQDGWEHAVAQSYSTFELEGSTRSGCRFCSFLLQCLRDTEFLSTFRKIESRLYHLGESAMSSLSIQNWGTNPSQILWLNLPDKVCNSCNSGIALDVKFDSCFLPATADCYDDPRDVYDIASNWLSTCRESHELCKSTGNGTLPTRLISINSESLRLFPTSELPNRPLYATLSHCWGSHNIIKLTSENLNSFMKVLPVERLPKTFKDAIKIAQRLGLDYLWIDSLCIIQDSEDDWQRESTLMNSIYGGSTITIAASSAQDSSQGCFLKQPHFSGGLRARITEGGRQRVQDFRNHDVYNFSVLETHLGTRAWALQEKMLPPRTIHFGDRGAFWECKTTIASEYLPDGFPNMLVSPLVRRRAKLEWQWPQIVQRYSAANLTFGKDKLPALSGIARLVYNETGDEYLAGMWKSQLVDQLCWRFWSSKSTARRPPWRAPTWSWAAVDGEVFWHQRQEGVLETEYAYVLDASTTKYGQDPFGQVTGGVIRLVCSTMAAGYLVPPIESNKLEAGEYTIIVSHTATKDQGLPIQLDCLGDGPEENNGPFYLLPFLGGRTGARTGEEGKDLVEELMIEGIVMQATGVTKGEFLRIGSFQLYKNRLRMRGNDDDDEEAYETLLRVLKDHGTATAEAACAEIILDPKYPDKRYVITLV